MLVFYSLISMVVFLLFGEALITSGIDTKNKGQQIGEAMFIGMASLGFFCVVGQLILKGTLL